jgi:methylmalonyl-CoA carboxyltransferase 1.3S subunit
VYEVDVEASEPEAPPTPRGYRIESAPLLVLKAMKMETNITAPTAGKIKAVTVAAGDSVQAGQVLVELE